MKYRDFFRHIQQSAKKEQSERSTEERLAEIADRLAEQFGVSPVRALRVVQERLSEGPTETLREWMEAKEDKTKQTKKSVDSVIRRLKDEANAPSVGDTVKVQFDEEARGTLTPRQEEINGAKGVVKIRDPFSRGSQRARYTVEIAETDEPQTVNNLTPGEVTRVSDTES
jgi:hypothetical protein